MFGVVAKKHKVSPEGAIYYAALKGRDQKGKFSNSIRAKINIHPENFVC